MKDYKLKAEHLRILRAARELIEKYGWCKDFMALDKDGEKVQYGWEESAVIWSMDGAIHKIRGMKPVDDEDNPMHLISKACVEIAKTKMLFEYNDDPKRTKEDILAIYDRAINICEDMKYGK